ncbi:hypothetical protein A2U01_0087358, partial [Trifolium medium]|nr:hypothetical protein [Trifolium medium]
MNSIGLSRGSQAEEESPMSAAGIAWDEDGWATTPLLPLVASP